ncbi:hypothetical protein ACIQCR_24660 [Streptomyces sp. NPDC093249]|uniref:hypothetical protein n=1 Tax=unclassified Streptomyces TaxID=2593676 RepID=UPI00380A1909
MRTMPRLIALAALAATLTACGTTATPDPGASLPKATATVDPKALESARAAAGLPPEPTATARQAYLDALNAIDPRIIKKGKEDQAVSRGLNQCSSIKNGKNSEAKLAETALERFTVTSRLPEIANPKTGTAINTAVHTHLCPGF